MFGGVRMGKERTEIFETHIQGLSGVPKFGNCRLSIDGDMFKIEHMTGGFLSNKNVEATYRIPLFRMISIDVVSEREIVEKSKSVIGRGIAGAVIFGPVGAIIGGMSGVGNKKSASYKYFVNLAYFDENMKDIKTIVFQADISLAWARQFIDYAMNNFILPLQKRDADIIL